MKATPVFPKWFFHEENAFTQEELLLLLDKAMKEDKEIAAKKVILKETEALLQLSGGDGRRLLNNFEIVVEGLKGKKNITNDFVSATIQQKVSYYDNGKIPTDDLLEDYITS